MGKKRPGRSVKRNLNVQAEAEELIQAPHSFVIHKGLPGGHILELTKDFRKVMEPYTASALKERKKNTIKDFVQIAGPLHVSHLCIFSRTELGVYLKMSRLPRGPTLTFKVNDFSLARDVVSSLKRQMVVEAAFKHSPLIILNSFSGEGMQMKLMASMFQNMFPTINLTKVDLNTVRRCVLMNYNPTTKLIDFRHFVIKVAPVGISKSVKKVVQGKVPNLAKCSDISEYLTKSGMLSESEAEDDPNAHVELSQKMISRGNLESGKSSIRLTELGPRLTLQLIKIEDGLLDGEVLYHDLVHKSEEEKVEIAKRREAKKKLKEKRKKIQEDNKNKNEKVKQDAKAKSMKGMNRPGQTETDKLMREAARETGPHIVDDDSQYYKDEVGEAPDKDLFSTRETGGFKRPPKTFHSLKRTYQSRKDGGGFDGKKRFDGRNGSDGKKNFDGKKRSFDPKRRKTSGGRNSSGPDKTNAHRRDFRPIGGGGGAGGRKKFAKKK